MNRRETLVAIAVLAVTGAARAEETPDLPLARDLREDGWRAAKARIPIIVLYSLAGCPYCIEVRRSHLLPMLHDPIWSKRVILRQVNVNGADPVIDFAGRKSSHGDLARANGVRVAPVVAFFDGQGKEIAGALRGMLLPDFYSAYLESAIASAESHLMKQGG